MNSNDGRNASAFSATLLGLSLLLAGSPARAQSSPTQTVSVPFSSPVSSNGYLEASAQVRYAFIACQGEIHIAYSLIEAPATVGRLYRLDGNTYPTSATPPELNSIHFSGTVYRGPAVVGHFADGLTGAALGMGCFSGQTQKVTDIADVLGSQVTPAQVAGFLNSLSLRVNAGEVLRSSTQESMIRGDLRRAEAEAAAAHRKADEEAQAVQARAEQEAAQKLAAERQATSNPGVAPASQYQPTQGRGFGTSPVSVAPTAPPLTRAERIANAIASDKVLADQRLEQQRAAYAEQQAALARAQQQQTEAMIAATPAVLEAAGSIYGALEAWDRRVKDRAYLAAQGQLAGKCLLPNGMTSPKDGEIQLGVTLIGKLSKHDCGHNSTDRYKGYKLEVPEPIRLQFRIKPAKWRIFTSYQIDVRDMDNKSHMFLGWQEWGAFQKVNTKSVELPAGIYIVTVSNGVQDIFQAFEMQVDAIGMN